MYNTVSGNAVQISGKTIQNLFERFDLKGDGVIDLDEYVESVKEDSDLIKWFEFLNKGI
jgi:Ca2+-binding EF-hand superfamily protein